MTMFRSLPALILAVCGVISVGASAQSLPVIGWVHNGAAETQAHALNGFRAGLAETGFKEGQNITVTYRWADHDPTRLPRLFADTVAQGVAVIIAGGGVVVAKEAKAATTKIPIVFMAGASAVAEGLVASMSRPGGNATGVEQFMPELLSKQIEIAAQLVPAPIPIAILSNRHNPLAERLDKQVALETEATLRRPVLFVQVAEKADFLPAFTEMALRRVGALLLSADSLMSHHSADLAALGMQYGMATGRAYREFAQHGGLFSFGPNLTDLYRQIGVYAGRILRGAKPEDLPVLQPAKFELVINLRTAKVLGLVIPDSILNLADEVIE